LKSQFGRIYTPLAWTVLIQVLLCLPGPALPETDAIQIPYFDKIIHVIIFGGFVWLWCLYFRHTVSSDSKLKTIFFCVYLAAAINGIAIEYIQLHFIPFRSFDEADIISDVLSASVVYGICNVRFLKTE
jgi:VanZ family protein